MGLSGEWAASVPDLAVPQELGNKALDFFEARFSVTLRMWAGNAWGLRGKEGGDRGE